MDDSEDNRCGTPKRVRWLFDDSFERSGECDGEVWESLERQSSMAVENFTMMPDTCVYNASESFIEGDSEFSSAVPNSSATLESVNEIRNGSLVEDGDIRQCQQHHGSM